MRLIGPGPDLPSRGPAATPTVVLAETESLSRSAMVEALILDAGVSVVAEAADSARARAAVCRHRPALLLVDAHLGGPEGGLGLVAETRRFSPDTAVLALSDSEQVAFVVRLLRAGSLGYVPRRCGLAYLVKSVHTVLRGEPSLPSDMLGSVLADLLEQRRVTTVVHGRYGRLSPREREVLVLLGRGLDNGGIARSLVISPETVRTHVQNVLGKLEVHSRVEAAALAVAHGLVEVGPPA